MDQPVRLKPSNAHKPRIRIVERRETVYEIRQPDYDVVRDAVGQVKAMPSGRFLKSMTCAELSGSLVCATRGAASRAAYALDMVAKGYQPILERP